MPKDPKTGSRLSYESLAKCLATAGSSEAVTACQKHFQTGVPSGKEVGEIRNQPLPGFDNPPELRGAAKKYGAASSILEKLPAKKSKSY